MGDISLGSAQLPALLGAVGAWHQQQAEDSGEHKV